MRSKDQWIADFHEWIPFAESLKSLDEQTWSTPIGKGKWCVRDIVSHIVRWDEYFLEEALLPILNGVPLTVRQLDFDAFNAEAAEWGRAYGRQELLQEAIQTRTRVLKTLQRIPESDYAREYPAPDHQFVIQTYIEDFIWHDQHHMEQIKRYIKETSAT